jgi:TP53 regulating kinase-like protein
MERMIRQGAEASIYLGEWYGKEAIFKIRKPKLYRQSKLDNTIRKRRTIHEASFLYEAKKAGVVTPSVYFLDSNNAKIIMQYMKGKRLRERLSTSTKKEIKTLSMNVGKCVAKLHKCQIMHGDLTTSNFIVLENEELALVDFGLSFFSRRIEDRAIDIHLIKEVTTSAHNDVFNLLYNGIINGYKAVLGENVARNIIRKVDEIESRGRYAHFG